MRNIRFLILALCMSLSMITAQAQQYDIAKTGLTLDVGGGSEFKYVGTAALYAPSVAVSNTVSDTTVLKLIGGNQMNALHFWLTFAKTSGTSDSMSITIWGKVADSKTPSTTTTWKSIQAWQTANASGEQLFETTLTGNNYTTYYIVTTRKSYLNTAVAGTVQFLCLVR